VAGNNSPTVFSSLTKNLKKNAPSGPLAACGWTWQVVAGAAGARANDPKTKKSAFPARWQLADPFIHWDAVLALSLYPAFQVNAESRFLKILKKFPGGLDKRYGIVYISVETCRKG